MSDSSREKKPPSIIDRSLWGLGTRVLGVLIVLSMVPPLVMAFQGYHCARQALIEVTEAHLLSVARSQRGAVETWLEGKKNALKVIARNPFVLEALRSVDNERDEAMSGRLSNLLGTCGADGSAYEGVTLFDAAWRVVAARRGEALAEYDVRLLPEAKRAMEEGAQAYVGVADANGRSGARLHVAHAVRDSGGGLLGAVSACLDLEKGLVPLLRNNIGLGVSGKAYALSKDLRIVAGRAVPENREALVGMVDAGLWEVAHSPSPRVLRYQDYLGNEVLGTPVRIPSLEWILVAEIDAAEAFRWLGILKKRATVTAGITLLAILGASVVISGRMARPFQRLAEVAMRIKDGRLQERVPTLPGEEAREVARSFNAMLDALEDTQGRLARAMTLATVGELTSSIVHEMRNPLSSIKMNLRALERRVADDADYCELAGIASAQVNRLEGMLTDLLGYGKPLELECRAVRFEDVAGDALEVVREAASAKNVSLETSDELEGRLLRADREQMCRVLTNLIDNAIQAVSDGGRIEISARLDRRRESWGVIEVRDDGRGLPENLLEDIFKPFTTTRQGGTGLGLANVKKIVELHGGSVEAHTRESGGSVFTVYIPLAE